MSAIPYGAAYPNPLPNPNLINPNPNLRNGGPSEWRTFGKVALLNDRRLEWQPFGMADLRNGGSSEWRLFEMVALRNGKPVPTKPT